MTTVSDFQGHGRFFRHFLQSPISFESCGRQNSLRKSCFVGAMPTSQSCFFLQGSHNEFQPGCADLRATPMRCVYSCLINPLFNLKSTLNKPGPLCRKLIARALRGWCAAVSALIRMFTFRQCMKSIHKRFSMHIARDISLTVSARTTNKTDAGCAYAPSAFGGILGKKKPRKIERKH